MDELKLDPEELRAWIEATPSEQGLTPAGLKALQRRRLLVQIKLLQHAGVPKEHLPAASAKTADGKRRLKTPRELLIGLEKTLKAVANGAIRLQILPQEVVPLEIPMYRQGSAEPSRKRKWDQHQHTVVQAAQATREQACAIHHARKAGNFGV